MNTVIASPWKALWGSVLLLLTVAPGSARGEVTLTEGPVNLRLYQRDANNVCRVAVKGSVTGGGKVVLRVYDDNNLIDNQESRSPFSFTTQLEAKLTNYRFEINGVTVAEKVVCGDAYIINGQSNAEAYQPYESNQWVRTFGTSDIRPDNFQNDTWGVALAHKFAGQDSKLHHIGCWGMKLGHMLVEEFSIPVAMINGARGGATLATGGRAHTRNDTDPEDPKTQYGRLLWRMRKAGLDQSVKAMLWHQGESSGGSAEEGENYYRNFTALMAGWKKDYPAMKTIYLFQTRPRGGGRFGPQVREAQRQLGARNESIHLMSTIGIAGYGGIHFHTDGYVRMAELLFPLIAEHEYGVPSKAPTSAPNIVKATYGNAKRTRIVLSFDQPVVIQDGALSLITLGGSGDLVLSSSSEGNSITIELSGAPPSDTVSYGDASKDAEGDPLIRGRNGIAALTFWQVPIER